MTFAPLFKKSLVYSLLGHLTVLSIFGFSFGRRLPNASDYARVSFWGDFLASYQVAKPLSAGYDIGMGLTSRINIIKDHFAHKAESAPPKELKINTYAASKGFIRPRVVLDFGLGKNTLMRKVAPDRFVPKKAEQGIVFHPVLPYDFTLYFRDRQIAHVELSFNIRSSAQRNVIDIKRKASSGNPEVDLLTMRYISRYLSIQQTSFSFDTWQTVKIDLSAEKR